MSKPIYDSKGGFYKDPITERVLCEYCFDGKHKFCAHGDCRCLHNFAVRSRKPEKDDSAQTDISGYGTIDV